LLTTKKASFYSKSDNNQQKTSAYFTENIISEKTIPS